MKRKRTTGRIFRMYESDVGKALSRPDCKWAHEISMAWMDNLLSDHPKKFIEFRATNELEEKKQQPTKQ